MSGTERSTREMRGDSSHETPIKPVSQPEEQEIADTVPDESEVIVREQPQQQEHIDGRRSSSSSSLFESQQENIKYAASSSAGVTFSPLDSTPSPLHNRKPPSPPKINSPPDSSSFSDDHCSPSHGFSPVHDEPISSTQPDNIQSGHQSTPAAVVVRSFKKVEPKVVTRVDPGAQEGFVGVVDVEGGSRTNAGGENINRRVRPDVSNVLKAKRQSNLNKFLLLFRISSFVFCMVSFSVMAADKKQGWALDSYYVYKEFRYVFAVNIIGFVYSGFQIYDLVNYLITRRQIIKGQIKRYVDFCMDQILTYLLMSASSSAGTRAFDWVSNWGKDEFPDMAYASVGLSFVGFVAFALCSLISGYNLCRSPSS